MLTFNRADEFNRDKFVLYKITCLIFTIFDLAHVAECEFLITGYELQFDISRYDWRKYHKNGKHGAARRCGINAVNKIFQNIDIGYNVNWQ